MPDADEAVRIREWQRLEQNAVDDAENRGVGADAESERENGDRGEQRGA
jgi:hypothetical protein